MPPSQPEHLDDLPVNPSFAASDLRRVPGLTDVAGAWEGPLTSITDDSRNATAGGLFVARGEASDRLASYVRTAMERGVGAIVVPAKLWTQSNQLRDVAEARGVCVAIAAAVDQALAGQVADAYFGSPAAQLRLVGVTGTNGKTTVAMLTQHLLRAAGFKPGLLGTIWTDVGNTNGPSPAELTTPGAIELRRHLAAMVRNGCDVVTMEVSSHALDQGRVAGLAFDAAVFTNLTQDHLDYHGTMEDYAAAKARLFTMLKPEGWAVVNGDDPWSGTMLAGLTSGRVLRTSVGGAMSGEGEPEVGRAVAIVEKLSADGSTSRFDGPWGSASARLPLVGEHNLSNALQAAAAAHTLRRVTARELRERLAACPPVPGRLEPVRREDGDGPAVLVDYAHTPDALDRVAATLKPLTHERGGRLMVLYGCGGDRDRTKRPKMTAAALRHADLVVLTSDNPRREDPQQILNDASAELSREDRTRLRTKVDRAAAIREAVMEAGRHDTVLIAGKGHEDYQVIADPPGVFGGDTRKIHFDDREHAGEALRAWRPRAVAC